jgi:diacylglycerol O-acyltransferase
LGGVLAEAVRSPAVAADQLRGQAVAVRSVAGSALAVASTLTGRSPSFTGPLVAELSEQRRFATVDTRLSHYRKVRKEHGGSVNDVILATIAGAFRSWLLTRAEAVNVATRIRALVPMSVVDDEFAEPTSLGSQVTPHMLSLPVGEANPVMRLHQVSYAFKAHQETGRAVAANKLAEIAGFAPTTFHAIGSRVAARHGPRSYQLLITNVPGPQFPLFAAGARMLASYPVQPLVPGHALAIGATSYDGKVFYGLNADRDALPDLDVLAQCIEESLEELVEASSGRTRAPRGRAKPPTGSSSTSKRSASKRSASSRSASRQPASDEEQS